MIAAQGRHFLKRDFFQRETLNVARDLIGCDLIADRGTDAEVVATIVETEAYLGLRDPASHAFRGPTPRSRIMFEEPGHLYVYFSYGMHCCANLVCEPHGTAGAVLLRAAAVVRGEDVVRARRGGTARPLAASKLLSGPANLARGLDLRLSDNGLDVCAAGSRLRLRSGRDVLGVDSGPRIGISRAQAAPYRFWWREHPAVSAHRHTGTVARTKEKGRI